MNISLKQGWKILQDVHDTAEELGLFRDEAIQYTMGAQLSEWEDLPELKQLQLLFADKPYWGRELRYFNQAPWWYKNEFAVPQDGSDGCVIHFTNVDYYCKVWLNGAFLGGHEGYSSPFFLRADGLLKKGEINTLMVKVWSPWDREVDGSRQDGRTFLVLRNMVKGTYEHSDTFIQRDINPVGIYGHVTVELQDHPCFEGTPEVSYTLDDSLKNAQLTVSTIIQNRDGAVCRVRVTCADPLTGAYVFEQEAVPQDGKCAVSASIPNPRLWNTWDRGGAYLYPVTVEVLDNEGRVLCSYTEKMGLRKVELLRDDSQTMFLLNGRPFYVRGTSYFPEVYVSAMSEERYKRDLLSMKSCGFNLIRVHVHVEYDRFYELCSELGLAVIQDSEYNWAHPVTDEFAQRFIDVFLETVDMLKRHSAILCWICMNEPGLLDDQAASRSLGRSMTINPGPSLYQAVRRHDPSRPAIKGSFCDDDPDSGDSHNYTGSLNGDDVHYSEIFGTTEKFNTEYGFDSPPNLENLKKLPILYNRLKGIEDHLPEIGQYQYALLKYYTEHYRMQKYSPNAGYVQFLFSDLCPQSFYGIFDWWGLPKQGLDAMLESNMPVGIFLKYRERLDSVFAVNDLAVPLGTCVAQWTVTDGCGKILLSGEQELYLDADSLVKVCCLDNCALTAERLDVALVLYRGDEILCTNRYKDVLHMPEHVKGHPSRISHETGMRLYFA